MWTPILPWQHEGLFSASSPVRIDTGQLQEEMGFLADFVELEGPLYLHKPLRVHVARHARQVVDVLRAAEREALAGHWVAGFLSFEAAAAFGLPTHPPTSSPLAWFAVFSRVDRVVFPSVSLPPVTTLSPSIEWLRYRHDIHAILRHIDAGESYQVNYTLTARLSEVVEPARLFVALQTAHRFPYAAWLRYDEGMLASFSPELFLQRRDGCLLTAPIKGTCARAADWHADAEQGAWLEQSHKNRAEHLMIVDMARNDLGKVCRTGTVQVAHLFERRMFSTVHHLETRVHGVQRQGLTLDQIMGALFPAASITGAPKRRTMEIIRSLEEQPRGVYTGALGVIQPGGACLFNVAIRTVAWHGTEGGVIGLGGGVVADSDASQEWEEIANKSRFLHDVPAPFDLVETFLLDQGGTMPRLAYHLRRLQASARCLGFACDRPTIETMVQQQAARWHKAGLGARVIRVVLAASGAIEMVHRPCSPVPERLSVRLALYAVDRRDRLLRHKTTRRHLFDAALATAREAGADDVLFCNNLGRVTEGAIRAIIIRTGVQWYAPPLEDGLLASVWRAEEWARLGIQEKSISLEALLGADEVWMGNSVQGGVKVVTLSDARGRCLATWEK